ncbi:hypothetical protein IWQ57_005420, partial [Coemansia nantahalensis]
MSVRNQSPQAATGRRKSPSIQGGSRTATADNAWPRYAPAAGPGLLLETCCTGADAPRTEADTQQPVARIGARPGARPTQAASPASAGDGLSMLTQTPSVNARSLSRRGSIALQSSLLYQRGMESESADSTANTWGVLASTRSMPSCPPGAQMQSGTPRPLSLSLTAAMAPVAAPDASPLWVPATYRDRRRSAAHERYPPLTSIFESGSGGSDTMSVQLDRWLAEHQSAAH